MWPKPRRITWWPRSRCGKQLVGGVLGRGRAVELAADQQGLDVGVAHGRVGGVVGRRRPAVGQLPARPQEVAGGRLRRRARTAASPTRRRRGATAARVAPDLGVREDHAGQQRHRPEAARVAGAVGVDRHRRRQRGVSGPASISPKKPASLDVAGLDLERAPSGPGSRGRWTGRSGRARRTGAAARRCRPCSRRSGRAG